jgi:hypothetical protein
MSDQRLQPQPLTGPRTPKYATGMQLAMRILQAEMCVQVNATVCPARIAALCG